MRSEPTRFPALDGRLLGGVLSRPPAAPRGGVVIAGATGVPHRFYAGAAEALSAAGFAVLRFDYRGLASSRSTPPRGEVARMRDWGALDIAGAVDWLGEQVPGVPLHLLGHSAGGWLPGFAANTGRLATIVTVASQSGYWRLWPWPERAALAAFWFAVLPLTVATLGYLPSWVLGGGESLPPDVARDWARWGRHPEFLRGDRNSGAPPGATPGFDAFSGRLLAFAVAGDDFYAPRAAVERFAGFYSRAAHTEVRDFSEPGANGQLPRHFTVFSQAFRGALISQLTSFLLADAGGAATT